MREREKEKVCGMLSLRDGRPEDDTHKSNHLAKMITAVGTLQLWAGPPCTFIDDTRVCEREKSNLL